MMWALVPFMKAPPSLSPAPNTGGLGLDGLGTKAYSMKGTKWDWQLVCEGAYRADLASQGEQGQEIL